MLLDALDAVPRERFLPLGQRHRADLDAALPLAHGQTTSQPSLIAQMVEALALVPESRVLEIGTGHGYEAAILSHLVAEVWTVEYVVQLADTAREILLDLGADNVHVVAGDGRLGLPEHAPYDGILVAAQCETLPPALVEQLAVGGRLVAPVGDRRAQRCVVLHRRLDGGLEESTTSEACGSSPSSEPGTSEAPLPRRCTEVRIQVVGWRARTCRRKMEVGEMGCPPRTPTGGHRTCPLLREGEGVTVGRIGSTRGIDESPATTRTAGLAPCRSGRRMSSALVSTWSCAA